jgi:DNA polymerase V
MFPLYAHVDCNNFYASCERVFRPDLAGRPIIVMSNNDGCTIARSAEVKRLGIKLGDPVFKIMPMVKKHDILLFSSNYELYGDLSRRVMLCLGEFCPEVEVYSIDEAFLRFSGFGAFDMVEYCRDIRRAVYRRVGLPVSVGLGETKTLAKLANKIAKKYPLYRGVFSIAGHPMRERILQKTPIGDLWGIGYRYTKKLQQYGVYNALDLVRCDNKWLRRQMNLLGLYMVMELRGQSSFDFDMQPPPKKQIVNSRSFSKPVTEWQDMREAVSTYIKRACHKLRSQGSMTRHVYVFITTNPFKSLDRQYTNATVVELARPTDYLPILVQAGLRALKQIFKEGYRYKKAGIMFFDLSQRHDYQFELFEPYGNFYKLGEIMDTVDSINGRFGKETLFPASSGIRRDWSMKRGLLSPHYTTRWEDLPRVRCL